MESKQIKVTCIENPLDPYNSQKVKEFEAGKSLAEYLCSFNPIMGDIEIVASIDGVVVSNKEDEFRSITPQEGSSVAFCLIPKGGGGGGGKNPLALVATLAVALVAPIAAPYLSAGLMGLPMTSTFAGIAGALSPILTSAISMGITAIGGLLVSSIFGGANIPDVGGISTTDFSDTPTYSWNLTPNSSEEGTPVPILYGKFRATPPIINDYVTARDDKSVYNALYCLADHQIDLIENQYINDNPVTNFDSIELDYRYGNLDQDIIPAFSDTRSDKSVGFKLSTDWSQSETSGNAVQGIGVGVQLNGLYYANDQGGLDSETVKLNIQYREKETETWYDFKAPDTMETTTTTVETGYWSAGYVAEEELGTSTTFTWHELERGSSVFADHTEGERYENDVQIAQWRWISTGTQQITTEVTGTSSTIIISEETQEEVRRIYYVYNIPAAKYEVRARFEEAPAEGTRHRNVTYFQYIQEIVFDDFIYPGTALMGLQAVATDQLSGSRPRVTVELTRNYVSVWNGIEYVDKPANNPAWACYDVLHNSEYGGGVKKERINYSEFEEWAAFCTSKNYTVNLYVDGATSTRPILDSIATLGRAAIVQKGSVFGVMIDRMVDMSTQNFLFTRGNMVESSFTEAFLPLEDRANAIEVTYFDSRLDYSRQIVEIYQDGYDTTENAVNKNQTTLFGCTDRQMAINFGRAMLLRNRYLTNTVSFDASYDAIACLPNDVIDVSSDIPQWGESSGRIVSATTNTVTLPEEVTLEVGEQYVISVKRNDDVQETVDILPVLLETTTNVLTIAGNWDIIPEEYDIYSFGTVDNITKQFRVLSITRTNDTFKRKITALEYIPEVYGDTTSLPDIVVQGDTRFVTDLDVNEVWVFATDGTGKSVIDINWRGTALSWNVFIKQQGGPWENVGKANKPYFRIDRSLVKDKTYEISVTPYSYPDLAGIQTVTILGKDAPPNDVTNFRAVPFGPEIVLTWDHIEDIDLLEYNIVEGINFNSGNPVASGVTENEYKWKPPISGTYTFWIKAKDRTFNESANAATTSATIDLSEFLNVVIDREEIPTYAPSASLSNLYYDSVNEIVSWIPGMTFDDLGTNTFEDEPFASYYFFDVSNGVYTSSTIDVGTVTSFDIRQRIENDATLLNPTFDDFIYGRSWNTFPQDTFSNITSLARHKLYHRYSDDDITYSDWLQFNGTSTISGRYVQIRAETDIVLQSTSYDFTSIYTSLDVEDKVKKIFNQAIDASGTTITLASIPITIVNSYNVGVSILGSSPLLYSVDIQSDEFTVYLFNTSGTGVSGTVNLEIAGF